MSLHAYVISLQISSHDPPFEALIMAAMRKADTRNFEALCAAFPRIAEERQRRYDAPAGVLPEEGDPAAMLPLIESFRREFP